MLDHRVDGFLEFENFAADIGGDLLGQVALGDRRRDLGDVAHLRGEIAGHRIDVVGEVLPGAGDAGHDRLAAQLAVGADFARHARHFRGETAKLIHHRVDGFFELKDLPANVHGDLFRQIAAGHRDGDFGNVAHLGREVAGHQVDAFGQVFPNAADIFDLSLAAELAFGADFARNARHFGGEDPKLIDHGVDNPRRTQEFALERFPVAFQAHGVVEIALGHAVDGAGHFQRRPDQIADQGIDRFFHALPGAPARMEGDALADLALLADHAADAFQFLGHALVGGDDLVERVRHFPFQAAPVRRQANGKVPILGRGEAAKDFSHRRVGRVGAFGKVAVALRTRFPGHCCSFVLRIIAQQMKKPTTSCERTRAGFQDPHVRPAVSRASEFCERILHEHATRFNNLLTSCAAPRQLLPRKIL